MTAQVRIVARSLHLRLALATYLADLADVRATERWPEVPSEHTEDVYITPVADCPLEACRQLTCEGLRIVVLAPVPRERERKLYLTAGAAGYLPMSVDPPELRHFIHSLSVGP